MVTKMAETNKDRKPSNHDRGSKDNKGNHIISENTNGDFRRGRIININSPTSKPSEPKPSMIK